jgi:hypothetical protein
MILMRQPTLSLPSFLIYIARAILLSQLLVIERGQSSRNLCTLKSLNQFPYTN